MPFLQDSTIFRIDQDGAGGGEGDSQVKVQVLSDGSFVFVWRELEDDQPDHYRIFVRKFTPGLLPTSDQIKVDGVFADFRDEDGLRAEAEIAAREGFTGKLAIHPAQVAVINAAFTPSNEDVAHARAIVDAFAAQPGAGVLSVDGKMVDLPHLTQARRVLERASR